MVYRAYIDIAPGTPLGRLIRENISDSRITRTTRARVNAITSMRIKLKTAPREISIVPSAHLLSTISENQSKGSECRAYPEENHNKVNDKNDFSFQLLPVSL